MPAMEQVSRQTERTGGNPPGTFRGAGNETMIHTGGICLRSYCLPKVQMLYILVVSEVFPKKPTCLFTGIFFF